MVADALALDPTAEMRVRLLAGNKAMIELDGCVVFRSQPLPFVARGTV